MRTVAPVGLLQRLSRVHGVQTAYYDVSRRRHEASADSLLAALRALGAPVAGIDDVPGAWREHRQLTWQRLVEPVTVAWDGRPAGVKVRLPAGTDNAVLACRLTSETTSRDTGNSPSVSPFSRGGLKGGLNPVSRAPGQAADSGQERRWTCRLADLAVVEAAGVEGTRYFAREVPLPDGLPPGYHRFTLEALGKTADSLVIAAPVRAYAPRRGRESRMWGVFLPLYALHSQRSLGSGDFSDLERLAEWVSGLGGGVVATLPFLAAFLEEENGVPGPYAPVSRLFCSEFYVDIGSAPELPECPAAQAAISSPEFQREMVAWRSSPAVDFRRQAAARRRILEELSRCCFARSPAGSREVQEFARANPLVEDYARFRAAAEKHRACWQDWPEPAAGGKLTPEDYDEEARRYHLYVQWLAHRQVEAVSDKLRNKGLRLYLDFPLGVHRGGYDVWRHQDLFVSGASAGAPPDSMFTGGQDWTFPPLHPEKLRRQSYAYHIACLRHHLQHAGILRIDHVMGLHRLFWIPDGLDCRDGVYVRYPADELYAILSLESWRSRAWIVGENLGTVPSYVGPALARHGIHGMYVFQYNLVPDPRRPFFSIPPRSVASLNTHDTPTFAGFWEGLDIEDRLQLGFLEGAAAAAERQSRRAVKEALVSYLRRYGWLEGDTVAAAQVARACLSVLGASAARLVLVNLEDLWGEVQPQNVPGTDEERPNWQRKARLGLEAFCQTPSIRDTLSEVDFLRKQGETDSTIKGQEARRQC